MHSYFVNFHCTESSAEHYNLFPVLVHMSVRVVKEEGSSVVRAEVGEEVALGCNYQMMGDSLYSIKWYRDDREFFRYIPRGEEF